MEYIWLPTSFGQMFRAFVEKISIQADLNKKKKNGRSRLTQYHTYFYDQTVQRAFFLIPDYDSQRFPPSNYVFAMKLNARRVYLTRNETFYDFFFPTFWRLSLTNTTPIPK